MRNIAMKVAYDGTNYHGFQRQMPMRKDNLAIQNVLEMKLEKIFGEKIELAAAGRTDSGVHALGQVVNFHTNGTIPVEKIPLAINSILPSDIVVLDSWIADEKFNARHSSKSKVYIYKILNSKISNPFLNRYAWHIRYHLDIEAMKQALTLLIGKYDFSSFKAASNVEMSPIRTILNAEIDVNETLNIKIHADGFLYHMARNIVGSLVAVGRERFTIEEFKTIFESHDRNLAAPTAPPQGLCLQEVFY